MSAAAKEEGNNLFVSKDFEAAELKYTTGIDLFTAEDPISLLVALYANRAACRIELNKLKDAAFDARRSLELDPVHAKSWFRLAKALPADDEEAGRAICAAVALSRGRIDSSVEKLYRQILNGLISSESELCLPESLSSIHLVSPGMLVISSHFRFESSHSVLCALPGKYIEAMEVCGNSIVLIGLGEVIVDQAFGVINTIFTKRSLSKTYIFGITFSGGRASFSQAAIAVVNSRIILRSCRFRKYAAAGICIVGEESVAVLSKCTFTRLPNMAIEAREGGSLIADEIEILECKQGITAYGGAEQINIHGSHIERCKHEGILLAGSFENAATMHQQVFEPKAKLTDAFRVSESAREWARSRGIQLSAKVVNCSVIGCESFGISIDYGAQVAVHGCIFRKNDPYALLVKGGSDLSIMASIIEYEKGQSNSHFIQANKAMLQQVPKHLRSKLETRKAGVYIGVNYNGSIILSHCVTVGFIPELSIFDEVASMQGKNQLLSLSSLYTKPPMIENHMHYDTATDEPKIEDLISLLPPSWQKKVPSKKFVNGLSNLAALTRPCMSEQNFSWSPEANEHYAIGNTKGYNILNNVSFPKDIQELSIMLGACGDPRNLIATISSGSFQCALSFVVNDGNVAILARNAVILHMISQDEDAEHILAVWANHALTEAQHESMMNSIAHLANNKWPGWMSASAELGVDSGDSLSEGSIRDVLRSWQSCTIRLSDILDQRLLRTKPLKDNLCDLHRKALGQKLYSRYQEEIKIYIETGTLLKPQAKVSNYNSLNVTMLLSELQYRVYFSSSIFRAIALPENKNERSAYNLLLKTLSFQMSRVSKAIKNGKIRITWAPGDIILGLTDTQGVNFDVIDCSNVADYVSLPCLLVSATQRLKKAPHATLKLESMVVYPKSHVKAIASFIEYATGCSLDVFESVLQVKLLSDSQQSHSIGSHGIRIAFSRQSDEKNPNWCYICKSLSSVGCVDLYARPSSLQDSFASPITLIHLISTCVPDPYKLPIVRTWLRCGHSKLHVHEWEIWTQLQAQSKKDLDALIRIKYMGKPHTSMMFHQGKNPVLLALSVRPLPEQVPIPLNEIKQLFSTFAWNGEMCTAHFLLLKEFLIDCNLLVSLVIETTSGLFVAASAETLIGLERHEVLEIPLWRSITSNYHESDSSKVITELAELAKCSKCQMVKSCSNCARCKMAKYCSKICQKDDWKFHKKICTPRPDADFKIK